MTAIDNTAAKPLMESMDHLDPLVKDPKAVEDFSLAADELIPKALTLASGGRLEQAVEELLSLEKKARFAFDGATSSRLLFAIAEIYFSRKDFEGFFELLPSLIKKRGQLKRPVSELIALCLKWVRDDAVIPDLNSKYRYIEVLVQVTEGKIFLEADRARVVLYKSQLLEGENKPDEACLVLQDEQVEIIGSMEQREKTQYIIDQMRLVLQRNDYIRFPIIAKKVNPKIMNAIPEISDLRIKYYELLILFHMHELEFVEVSNCYRQILNTPPPFLSEQQALEALVAAALFLLLSPVCDAQRKTITELLETEKRRFDDLVPVRDLARSFLGTALIGSVPESVISVARVFGDSELFKAREISNGEARIALLHKRIVQFNLLRVLSKFYARVRLTKIASILGVTTDVCESEITELVSDKSMKNVKIDRPAGIVTFHPRLSPQAKLDLWAGSINKALGLVETASNLIEKEVQLHSAREKIQAQLAKDKIAAH